MNLAHVYLAVSGARVPDSERHRYTMRFTTSEAVLYLDGKRVTKAWVALVSCSVEEDKRGANANTA